MSNPTHETKYHIGFGRPDLGDDPPIVALVSGDPERARRIAEETPSVQCLRRLSAHRALNSYLAVLPNGQKFVSATSGMGSPSLSIVVNELVDVGIRKIIRIGTSGSIQPHVQVGSVVITSAALCRQGAAQDIAPVEYPAAADPFLTVALVEAARRLGVSWHMGITASVDTFYEGQERIDSSANKYVLPWLRGMTEAYRRLNILNYEMEVGTLLKMAGVYGFSAGCVCAVVAQRTASEHVAHDTIARAEHDTIQVALGALSDGSISTH